MASAYAGIKVRQIKRDAILAAFIAVMAMLAMIALLGAFAAYVAQTHGVVIGLVAAAGLPIALSILAFIVRVFYRRQELRRRQIATSRTASVLAVSSAAGLISGNKAVAIIAGVTIGVVAASLIRSGRE